MKRFLSIFLLPLLVATGAFAQNKGAAKTGWKVSPFPAVSYDSNNGFQYGIFGDIYNYGDGTTYPDPLHKFSFEASHFTKGRSRFRLSYDSKYLIPDMRLTVSAIYVSDPLYQFYGYNGAASIFHPDLNKKLEDGSFLRYNSMQRSFFQAFANIQGIISGPLNWAAGFTYWHFKAGSFDGSKFQADPAFSLYDAYVNAGLIGPEEKNGGNILELRAGLAYNSRDVEAAPNRGINADVFLNGAPDFTKSGHAYLRLCANFSHFVRIPVGFIAAGDPVFAYHLGLQHTWGDAPFYIQQNVPQLVPRRMMSEGLGGNSTIRGMYENRVIADGFAWANTELRIKFVKFQLFNQDFYVATNPFFDFGMITKPYRFTQQQEFELSHPAYGTSGTLTQDMEKRVGTFLMSAGIGLKLAWNENFILSAEIAHNLNDRSLGLAAPLWVNIITNYSF
ncbi:MAG: hypothetical protein K5849_07200 [Bacteroidales bacterium]|nr:hypothetical protein [Bacteroidales bacterium]